MKGKFLYRYKSGLEVIGNFKSNTTLEWETLSGPFKGQTGIEVIETIEVSNNVFLISWLEKSGTGVSQIMDLNRFKVRVFLTFDTDKGQQSFLDEGTIEEIKSD